MSLAQGNNTPSRPRIEPGSPDPESDALTTRPVRPQKIKRTNTNFKPACMGTAFAMQILSLEIKKNNFTAENGNKIIWVGGILVGR